MPTTPLPPAQDVHAVHFEPETIFVILLFFGSDMVGG